jgi:hypothetical protein
MSKLQINLPTTGLASIGRGVARRIRVKPRNDADERDLKSSSRTPKILVKTIPSTLSTMQDPDHAVGEEKTSSFVDPTTQTYAPVGTSALATAAIPTHTASAPAIDEATKKAVDNVLYSDVRIATPMRQTHAMLTMGPRLESILSLIA